MSIIKKKQIKELSDDDLKVRLNEMRLELAKDKAQIAIGGNPSSTGKVRNVRKTIARLLTEIKRRP